MGIWGTGIFSNDFALDLKTDYKEALSVGLNDREAFEYIKPYLEDVDDEDFCSIWCGLALTMWQTGRLTEEIKTKVIDIIDDGGDIWLWQESGASIKEIEKRKKVLYSTKETLLSPMKEKAKFSKPFKFICPWKSGDVVLYKIDNNGSAESRYAAFCIISVNHKSHRIQDLEEDTMYVVFHNKLFLQEITMSSIKRFSLLELESDDICKKTTGYYKDPKINKRDFFIAKHIRSIWTLSKKDYNIFLEKCTLIGRIETKNHNISKESVYRDYEMKALDTTLLNVYARFGKKSKIKNYFFDFFKKQK